MYICQAYNWLCISRFMTPGPLGSLDPRKVTANLKLNKRKVKYFQLLQKKPHFFSSRKQPMVPLDKGLQQVNITQKPFRQSQAHSGIIRHIEELFRHIPAYFEPCVTLTLLEPQYIQTYSETDTYSELQHIHKTGIFSTPVYSKHWHIKKPMHIPNTVKHLR